VRHVRFRFQQLPQFYHFILGDELVEHRRGLRVLPRLCSRAVGGVGAESGVLIVQCHFLRLLWCLYEELRRRAGFHRRLPVHILLHGTHTVLHQHLHRHLVLKLKGPPHGPAPIGRPDARHVWMHFQQRRQLFHFILGDELVEHRRGLRVLPRLFSRAVGGVGSKSSVLFLCLLLCIFLPGFLLGLLGIRHVIVILLDVFLLVRVLCAVPFLVKILLL